ncbi:MAG: hypothetical protein DI563_18650 [Variovorax paradoxus]|jgi:uncharacterized protein YgbK (DUF1537 family)|uniref:Four-carbon acid sugar kinase family protein n=1 Tax=Variovorax paradoxus TaxID=34073 RepID=A0A2W5Q6F7_VARPD|nr:MAG: hypothetical protein DI563_18650 [Variovorax paradoxus]
MNAIQPDRPALLFYGDDFTGATDALATAAEGGLRSLLFLRVPDDVLLRRAGPLNAVGIAGATRSMPPGEIAGALAPVARLARRLRPRVLHYKTCSTFDSAPHVGSIGAAVDALRSAADVPWVAVVGGQPQLGRYCVFGQLFAAAGPGGEVFRIDRHPTMSRHPVTPMGEADLRQHLAAQGLAPMALVPWTAHGVDGSNATVQAALDAALLARPAGVLFDVASPANLRVLGPLLRRAAGDGTLLAAGPSSVVDALGAGDGGMSPVAAGIAPARTPVLGIAGSLSPLTARQVAAATAYVHHAVPPVRLLDATAREAAAQAVAADLRAGRHALVVTAAQDAANSDGRRIAQATGQLLAEVLTRVPLSRVGIAGGDTSSHAVQALDAWGLSHRARIAPGVALCRLHSERPALDGMELMLKGGQMGGESLFDDLVHGTVGQTSFR